MIGCEPQTCPHLPSRPSGVLHACPGADAGLAWTWPDHHRVTPDLSSPSLTLLLRQSQPHHPHEPPVDTEVLAHANLTYAPLSCQLDSQIVFCNSSQSPIFSLSNLTENWIQTLSKSLSVSSNVILPRKDPPDNWLLKQMALTNNLASTSYSFSPDGDPSCQVNHPDSNQ